MATDSHQPFTPALPIPCSMAFAACTSTGSTVESGSSGSLSSDDVEPHSRSLGNSNVFGSRAPIIRSCSREEGRRDGLRKCSSDGAYVAPSVGGPAGGEGSGETAGRGGNGSETSPGSTVCQATRVDSLRVEWTDGKTSGKTGVRWGPLPGCEKWEIRLEELFIGQRFATGTYGRLYQGCYKGMEVAVKFLVGPDSNEEQRKIAKQFAAEVKMYSKCSHPNVLKVRPPSPTIHSHAQRALPPPLSL